MVRQTATVIVLEILGGLILLTFVLAGLVLLRLSSGPIDLSAFREDVEQALSDNRQGRPVAVGALQLEWSRENRRVEVTAQNLRLMDEAGRPAAEAANASIILSASALLFGDFEILALQLEDGWIAFDQIGPQQWAIAGDPLPPFRETVLPDSPQGWIDYTGRVLPAWLRAVRETESGISLERAGFDRFEMRIRNTDRVMIGRIEQAGGSIARAEDGLSLSLSGSGLGDGLPGGIHLRADTSDTGRRMRAEIAINDWPLGDLGARFGLDPQYSEGLLSDIQFVADLTEATGIEQVAITARSGEGSIVIGGTAMPVRDLDLAVLYNEAADRLNVRLASRGAGPFTGTAEITLDQALDGAGFRPFALTSPAVTLDLTPTFEAPLDFASVKLSGEADLDLLAIRQAVAEFVSSGAAFRASGELARTPDRAEGEPPVLGNLELSVPGSMPVEAVFRFWPVELGASARRFGVTRVETGMVHEALGRITLARDSLQNGQLRDDHLEVTFLADDVRVRFLDDLPPVEAASGNGRLTGNSFSANLATGQFSGWALDEGLINFPAFYPRGEPFRVFARGRGPAPALMKALVESRLAIDFDHTLMTGNGDVTFEMFRPALNNVPYEDVRFTAIGTVRGGGLRNAALGFDLTGTDMKVDVDQAGATLTGAGRLGPSDVDFRWRQGFAGGEPANLTATGTVSADFLNRFGLLGRAYMTGEAPVSVTATLDGANVLTSSVRTDLTGARLDISEIGWIKPAGTPANAEFDYAAQSEQASSRIKFTSDSARLDGDFTLGADTKLLAAELREAYFRNVADVAGSVSRGRDERLTVSLRGRYLDISGILPAFIGMAAAAPVEGGEAEDGIPISLTASVDRLTLRPELDLRDARLSISTGTNGLETMQASGTALGGAPLEAVLNAQGEGPPALMVTSGDAGFLASAFLGADFITGGQIELLGTLETKDKPADMQLLITNARMKDAPFLTQILSLASLRGLADTLGGEGVMFSRIEASMKVSSGRYVIEGAKAQGPALGLTASGYVDMESRDIEIDGVLVPSFGINSALGGIPIIGDLVVGRDGEGVFSLTYSVRGTLEKANVGVNPLSALAPGVIRRIFENPSDTKIPEAVVRPPDEPLPTELPPIKEETF